MARRIDPRLGNFARTMRQEPTPPEAALWKRLAAQQLDGLKFRRQSVLGAVIVDFYCPAAKLVVELDGNSHGDGSADAIRDAELARLRELKVLRFSNQQVGLDLDGVLRTILHEARARQEPRTLPQPLPGSREGSLVAPLPEREGLGEGRERSEHPNGTYLLGLDPGLAATGWGVIEVDGNRLRHIAHGTVKTRAADALADRLAALYDGLHGVIAAHACTSAAVEEVFVNANPQSTLKLGQARGVVLLAAAHGRLAVSEYATRLVKKAVVGTGGADKHQVHAMVERLLPGVKVTGEDAADALAVAIAHAHLAASARTLAAYK